MKKTALLSLLFASSLFAAPQALHNDTKTGLVTETPIKFTLNQLYLNGTLLETQLSSFSLPTQTGNSGKFLTTNGSVTSWNHDTATGIGATTVGSNIFALTNPSAITFLQINANNTVSALSASAFRTAIGAGTSSFSGAFTDLSGRPTTISGYGITDAQPLDADLTAIAALSTTSFGRGLLSGADAAAIRTYIGAGAASFDGVFSSLSGIPTTIAGYGITDAQPLDSDLTSIAVLLTTSFGRGFLPLANAGAARTYIGAGTSSFDGAFSSLSGVPSNVTNAIASIPVSNTLYVDPTGNDGTGLRGRFDKPFATLSAAHTAASAGDLIVWNSGSYTPGAGATTISKNNITILAYGVVFNASSGTDYTKLIISGSGIKIYGLEIDGKYTSGGDTSTGLIQVTGANAKLRDLYLHDHASDGVRAQTGSSGLSVAFCRIVNADNGIKTVNASSSATLTGLSFTNNIIDQCRYDAIAHYSTGWTGAAGTVAIQGTVIANNTLTNTHAGVEVYANFMDGVTVSNNYIANIQYGVSVAPATHTLVIGNTIKGPSYAGVEFANAGANAGNLAVGNNIDLLDESGTYNGGTGYVVNRNTGTSNNAVGLHILGGSVSNTGGGGGGTSGGAVRISNTDDVVVENLYTYGTGHPVEITDSNDITVQGCKFDINIDTAYGINTQAASTTTRSNFYYRNNRFWRGVGYTASGYATYHFYSAAANATFNGVNIEGTRTNQTFAGSGFVNANGNTVNIASQINNLPQTTPALGGTYGFKDSQTFYDLQVSETLTMGDHTPTSTATPRVLDMGGTFSNTAGTHLKLQLYNDGTNIYGLGVSASEMDFGVPSSAGYGFFVGGTLKAKVSSTGDLTLNGLTASEFIETDTLKKLVSKTAAQMRTDLALDTSANLAAAISDEVGYSTGAKLVFSQGPTIYDNAGTPKPSIDAASRVLYSSDGTTEIIDWNGPSVTIGSITIGADGTSDLVSGAVGDLTHQFGYGLDVNGNSFAPASDLKISSQDDSTYFDNSGFHGVLVGTIGTPAAKPGGSIFVHYADTSTTHTNGTEDDLYSDTLVASTLGANGDSVYETEHASFVSSATAARRLKKYFGGTLIFDSGSLTLTLGGDFTLQTTIIRESSSVVRCDVAVTSTSASTVPYSTYTRITGLTLTNTQVLKTTGIASGTGAASGDVVDKLAKTTWSPAP